jgi:hypothetical protein
VIGVLLLLLGTASAAEPAMSSSETTALRTWSTTAVEALPDLSGDTRFRLAERFGVAADLGSGWRLNGVGGFRLRAQPHELRATDIWRASVEHRGDNHRLSVGRFVRVDPRGVQRLDGIAGELDDGGTTRWGAWLGRRWHPEAPTTTDAWVGGTEVRLRGRTSDASVGAEARAVDGELEPRIWIGGSTRSIRGDRASVLVEAGADNEMRAALEGQTVAGRWLDVGLGVRWEGLAPASALDDPRSPIEWLAPKGYGIAEATARWRRGDLTATCAGGTTLRPGLTSAGEPDWSSAVQGGGQGRAALGYRLDERTDVAVFASSAGLGVSWLAGGGAAFTRIDDGWDVVADAAVWRIAPLDRAPGVIAELRTAGRVDVMDLERSDSRHVIAVGAQLAAGRDRQLSPYLRGGVELTARIDGGRR